MLREGDHHIVLCQFLIFQGDLMGVGINRNQRLRLCHRVHHNGPAKDREVAGAHILPDLAASPLVEDIFKFVVITLGSVDYHGIGNTLIICPFQLILRRNAIHRFQGGSRIILSVQDLRQFLPFAGQLPARTVAACQLFRAVGKGQHAVFLPVVPLRRVGCQREGQRRHGQGDL